MTPGTYFRTLRHLKWRQIYYQLYYRIKKARILTPPPGSKIKSRSLSSEIQWKIFRPYPHIVQTTDHFKFLNVTKNIRHPSIWNDDSLPKLWRYNLHYFDYLFAPEKQFSFTEKQQLMKRWVQENPCGNHLPWEPYPTSLRIVNWIKFLLHHSYQDIEIEQSLWQQAEWIRLRPEYHLLGNHLLANAKALIFAGLFFQDSSASLFYQSGIKLYSLDSQFMEDGGHAELSPMYHAIILEDLLDILQIQTLYHHPYGQWGKLKPLIQKMLQWLCFMTHPDGEPAFFNDTTLGIAASYEQLSHYANFFDIPLPQPLVNGQTTLTAYHVVQHQKATLFFDMGEIGLNYLPGHAHADTLSFELSLDKSRIFVNSGISSYEDNEERLWQRGTAAHNTLRINGENSSEVWRSFRVGRRAQVKKFSAQARENEFFMSAQHNGYQHRNGILHERFLSLNHQQLEIKDTITGRTLKPVLLEIFFHLHPQLHVEQNTATELTVYDHKKCIGRLQSTQTFTMIPSFYYPEFGKKISNHTVLIQYKGILPCTISTKFSWF